MQAKNATYSKYWGLDCTVIGKFGLFEPVWYNVMPHFALSH